LQVVAVGLVVELKLVAVEEGLEVIALLQDTQLVQPHQYR
jgi:hypothetical protein